MVVRVDLELAGLHSALVVAYLLCRLSVHNPLFFCLVPPYS
jgi:hypothetical protein